MMRFPTYLLLLLASLGMTTATWAKTAKVTGKINSKTDSELQFREYGLPFNFDPTTTVEVSETAEFSTELELKEAQYYFLIYKKKATLMFISPGDEIYLEFDGRKLVETVEYSGKGAEINNYLKTRLALEKGLFSEGDAMYTRPWEEFKSQIADAHLKMGENLDIFLKGKKIKGSMAAFSKLERAHINGVWGRHYMRYPSMHAFKTKTNALTLWPLLDKGQEAVDALIKDDEDLLASKGYRDFLNQYLFAKADRHFNEKGVAVTSRSQFIGMAYGHVEAVYPLEWQQEYMKARVLFEHMDRYGTENMTVPVQDYRNSEHPEVYTAAVDRAWNKWEAIKPGKPAPDIVGTDIDGNEIRLSDFKGKVVYIDVWATWCGPCRKEIPFLRKTEEEMHGEDVVFLSVSIDNNRERWAKMVKDDDMKGVQMHVTGGWGADVCRQYLITGIPRFMVMDKEGNIVNIRAPRPSQNVAPMLRGLL